MAYSEAATFFGHLWMVMLASTWHHILQKWPQDKISMDARKGLPVWVFKQEGHLVDIAACAAPLLLPGMEAYTRGQMAIYFAAVDPDRDNSGTVDLGMTAFDMEGEEFTKKPQLFRCYGPIIEFMELAAEQGVPNEELDAIRMFVFPPLNGTVLRPIHFGPRPSPLVFGELPMKRACTCTDKDVCEACPFPGVDDAEALMAVKERTDKQVEAAEKISKRATEAMQKISEALLPYPAKAAHETLN